jgi:hypothetical protein
MGSSGPDIGQNDMSDRKHLTTLEVDRLLAAAKGSRNEAPRPLFAAADVPARLARVRGVRVAIVPWWTPKAGCCM